MSTYLLYAHFWVKLQKLRHLASLGSHTQLDSGRPYVDSSPSNMLHSLDPLIRRWGDPQVGQGNRGRGNTAHI